MQHESSVTAGIAKGAAVAAAIAFVFLQPLFEVADPILISAAGFMLATAVGGYWFQKNIPHYRMEWFRKAMIAGCAVSYAFFLAVFLFTMEQRKAVGEVCHQIEKEMLAAQPRRTDTVDLFNALNCWPTGEHKLEMPSLTKPLASPAPSSAPGSPPAPSLARS